MAILDSQLFARSSACLNIFQDLPLQLRTDARDPRRDVLSGCRKDGPEDQLFRRTEVSRRESLSKRVTVRRLGTSAAQLSFLHRDCWRHWRGPLHPMTTTQLANPRTLRPRSRPLGRSAHRLKPGWRYRAAVARSRTPKGVLTFWTRARRFFWSWWPWAIVSIWAISDARWGLATGCAAMATVNYLLAPAADPPRFGLDHEFSVESPEFATTMAGASGNPFLPGNRLELLNNGDAFYPSMLDAIKSVQIIDHG